MVGSTDNGVLADAFAPLYMIACSKLQEGEFCSRGLVNMCAFFFFLSAEMLKVSIQSVSPLNVSNGTTVSVVCSLGCSCGGAQLTWSRIGYPSLPSTAAVALDNSGRSLILSFPKVTADIGGEYTCTASNGAQLPANETLVLQVS